MAAGLNLQVAYFEIVQLVAPLESHNVWLISLVEGDE